MTEVAVAVAEPTRMSVPIPNKIAQQQNLFSDNNISSIVYSVIGSLIFLYLASMAVIKDMEHSRVLRISIFSVLLRVEKALCKFFEATLLALTLL